MTALHAAALAVTAGWGLAAAETYLLAARRGRMAVRRGARRARVMLIACAAAAAGLLTALASLSPGRALIVAPLLALPGAAALGASVPAAVRLAGFVRADPWGPSDPPVRRVAAAPALTVPARAAFVCGCAALLAMAGGPVTVTVAYAAAGAATTALTLRAPRRLTGAADAGMLHRVVVGPLPVEDRRAA